MACSTSCTHPESGWVTTCGGYNGACYNVPVCGNRRCEPKPRLSPPWIVAENHSNCPRDCTDKAGPERNACATFVPDQFDEISTGDKTFKINNHGGSDTAQPQWDELENGNFSNCHFQGVARLRTSPWIAVVGNNVAGDQNPIKSCRDVSGAAQDDGAVLFFARMDSKASAGSGEWGGGWSTSQDQVESFLTPGTVPGQWHPGGMQAIGDYLVVGVDSSPTIVFTIDVANPYYPWTSRSEFDLDELDPKAQANAVGVVKEARGAYLLAAFTGAGKKMRLYRSQGTYGGIHDIATPDYEFVANLDWQQPSQVESYEGMALVRECGTDTIYMFGFYNTAIGGQIGGSNKAQLWRIDIAGSSASATHVRTRDFGDADSSFDASAGLYIEPNTGQLVLYSTEHWNDGATIVWPWEDKNRDLDVSEWW